MDTDRPLVALLMAALVGAALVGRNRPRLARVIVASGILLLGGMLVVRWIVSGHPPVFGTFETDLAETFCLLVAALWLDRRVDDYLRAPTLLAILTLGHTFLLHHEITPLTISEISLWIDLHAPLAWLAWCLYLNAACLAFHPTGRDLAFRVLGLGFAAQTAMAFVGVYYATLVFAKPWEWDPIQSLALMSWLLFAVSIHLRLFFTVSMHRQRYFLAFLVLVFVVSAKLVMFLPGQSFHVFELGAMAGE